MALKKVRYITDETAKPTETAVPVLAKSDTTKAAKPKAEKPKLAAPKATVAAKAVGVAQPKNAAKAGPTRDEIARLAYLLAESRIPENASPAADWTRAERYLSEK
jgi:hypothetical protein